MFQVTKSQEQVNITYKTKTITVTAIFPERSDPALEQEFINRLKELYFRKLDFTPYE